MFDTADHDEHMLARLAEFDLAAAERVHGRLMAAEAAHEIAELGRTYQRVARSLRQTLALKAKLKHDREAAARQAPASPRAKAWAVARRVRQLRHAMIRVVWNEAEAPERATWNEERLDEILALEMAEYGFADEPLDEQVMRVCLDLGLSPKLAAAWRDLPDPAWDPGDLPTDEPLETSERQSSA